MKMLSVIGVMSTCALCFPLYAEESPVSKGTIEISAGNILRYTINRGNATHETSVRPISTRESSFGLSNPSCDIGYFIMDNISVGGGVSNTSSTYQNKSDSNKQLGISPFMKYYIPVTDRFIVDYIARIGIESGTNNDGSTSSTQLNAGMGAAMNYLFFKSLGIYLAFDYKVRFSSIIGKTYRSGYEQYTGSIGSTFFLYER
jgi:hypothetical protein